jgi:hypothetical protein
VIVEAGGRFDFSNGLAHPPDSQICKRRSFQQSFMVLVLIHKNEALSEVRDLIEIVAKNLF